METDKIIWDATPTLTIVLDKGQIQSSFYLPPLAGINVLEEYGYRNFKKALMIPDSPTPQFVCFVGNRYIADRNFSSNPNYVSQSDEYLTGNFYTTRILYNVPAEFHADYYLFAAGHYSEMSESSKQQIILSSGCRFKYPAANPGTFIYDKRIMVLYQTNLLRTFIEKMLDIKLQNDVELLDRPGLNNFWWG